MKMFRENFLHADVLCVVNYSEYILAGIGSSLFVYKNGSLRGRKKIFGGERIHQIYITNGLFVKGGKELAEVELEENKDEVVCVMKRRIKCKDWIQDVLVLNDELVVATSHNVIERWTLESGECSRKYLCEEKCILYSCKLFGQHFEDLIVLAGTVFSEVVIWNPVPDGNLESIVLHRLKGHNGVIFSVEVDTEKKLISTTSDDRTLRIWSISTPSNLSKKTDWETAEISILFTVFGHTARVWKNLILKNHFISVGEDSKLNLWDETGKLDKSISLHQSSGIRGLHFDKNLNSILTGGEDGGIVVTPYRKLLKNYGGEKLEIAENLTPHRVAFSKNEIIISTNEGIVAKFENGGKFKILYENPEFSNYCLLEFTKCRKFVGLGSLRGRVVVLNTEDGGVVFNEVLVGGKIFSMHFTDGGLVTCGANGEIKVWELNFPKVNLVKNFILPSSKERWTTCAVVERGCYLMGDRMGNFYFFKTEKNPIQSFKKIHGCLGVTDVISEGDVIFTSGRDGTVKEFTLKNNFLEYSLSYKLPMEWIWRIVNFKSDNLVLGFSSVFLIVWSLTSREILIKYNCGGGHRSCDYKIHDDSLLFIYVKEKNLYSIRFDLDNLIRLRNGYHTKEINSLKILSGKNLIISGSEDTTLRISRIKNQDVENLYVLENHISSIRAVAVYDFSASEKILIAAGGRAQISLWKFNVEDLTCKELETLRLKKTEGDTNYEPNLDPETRFMCLDSRKISDRKFLIASGCSDCKIRIFSYEKNLILEETIDYTHCVLKILLLNCNFMVSFGTDGKIVFWKIGKNSEMLKAVQMHQSGINSFAIKDLDLGLYVLATGGDDNLLTISMLELDLEKGDVRFLSCWKNTKAHSCQITGILLTDEFMLTTSIDQRLTVWRYKIEQDNNISAEFIEQYLTPVPDVQGMEIYNAAQGKNLSVCVYGKGIEIVNVNLES